MSAVSVAFVAHPGGRACQEYLGLSVTLEFRASLAKYYPSSGPARLPARSAICWSAGFNFGARDAAA